MSLPFQLTETPLNPGVWLIEASAGTGKTYTIAGLFVRLVVELGFSVREILVVTFTEAATEELRDRVRNRLAAAARALAGEKPADEFLAELVDRHAGTTDRIRERLELALRDFDEAPIYTIHGFCQRMLQDRAFETGTLFDTELVSDPTPLLQEVADDFWRQRFYRAQPLPVSLALLYGLTPDRFRSWLQTSLRHPELRFLDRLNGRNLVQITGELSRAFANLRDCWATKTDSIRACFGETGGGWANKPYNRDVEMAPRFATLSDCFAGSPLPDSLQVLPDFAREQLAQSVNKRRKNAAPPTHRFFDLCEEWTELASQFAVALRLDFHRFVQAELPRRKVRLKQQTFDDLLTRLRDALRGDASEALARAMRMQFRAALIDEFQDTDPVQWEIFRRVFVAHEPGRPLTPSLSPNPNGGEDVQRTGEGEPAHTDATRGFTTGEAPPTHRLFLIGDPKQAIYGFRGADIFTYLAAARTATERFTLGENWRSESGLVRAVNTLFGRPKRPFLFDEIRFEPAVARGQADQKPIRQRDGYSPGLELWFYPREEPFGETPPRKRPQFIGKTEARARITAAVVEEIVRLLNGDARLGERGLRPEDIAVLVRTNSQAQNMQAALKERGVPAVLQTNGSLFESDEAWQVHQLLAGVAQPADERCVKAALATPLLGLDGSRLEALGQDEVEWQEWLNRFREYRDRWNSAGFFPMFRELLQREGIRPRLLALADGDRRLTNVLHLAEVLHTAAMEHQFGTAGLVQWLGEQFDAGETVTEEFQLRLERDENAVQLVTIHKSKGLEYNVVFCPFSWEGSELTPRRHKAEGEVLFHTSDPEPQLVQDLGPGIEAQHCELAQQERLAENIRLLYVALTRARHRVYFVWGAFKGTDSSAPAWLLHPPPHPGEHPVGTLQEWFETLDDDALRGDLERLVTRSAEAGAPALSLTELPTPGKAVYQPPAPSTTNLRPRDLTRRLVRDWHITSFSALTTGAGEDLPDHDNLPALSAEEEPATGIFAFPRGAQPGTCLHEIFEQLDFAETNERTREALVRDQLASHGLSEGFVGPVCEMLAKALVTPLNAHHRKVTLAGLLPTARQSELEFYYPLRGVTPPLLHDVFTRHSLNLPLPALPEQLGRLEFAPTRGFMRGFIDLVAQIDNRFYLVDWKSNWLGNRTEDYAPPVLATEMAARFYVLQYHFYALALHRLLRLRRPGYDYTRDFGGVAYLFLRGLDPTRPELGVFRDRPAPTLIEELEARLLL